MILSTLLVFQYIPHLGYTQTVAQWETMMHVNRNLTGCQRKQQQDSTFSYSYIFLGINTWRVYVFLDGKVETTQSKLVPK